MVILYHYTTKSGFEGIKKDRVIRRSCSRQKDACYGPGVYLTSLNPKDHDKEYIAKNNWLDGGSSKRGQGHLDCYIEIVIPDKYKQLKADGLSDGRDVFRYNGDINLDDFEWRGGYNADWTPLQIAAAVGLGAVAVGGLALLGKYVYDQCTKEPVEKTKEKDDDEEQLQGDQSQGCTQQ